MKLSRAPALGRRAFAAEREQDAALIALDGEHRMHDQADLDPPLVELGEHRIEQERHVVVDDLEHRDRLDALRAKRTGRRFQADLRDAGLAVEQERPGFLGQGGELARLVDDEILGRGTGEQARRKARGHVVAQAGEDRAHLLDEPLRGALLLGADKGRSVHLPRPSRFPAGRTLPHPGRRVEREKLVGCSRHGKKT